MASRTKKPTELNLRPWPADYVTRWPIERVKPYPNNARLHSDEQVGLIANSISKFGFTAPLLVDESGVLIYGHGRLAAAQKLGIKDVPVCIAEGWSEEDKNGYRIADNQIGLRSEWDMPLLKAEIRELSFGDYDLNVLGFSENELQWFSADPESLQLDPVEAWTNMPGFKMGDKTAFRSVIVHFRDQAAVEEFEKLIGQKMNPKAKFIWHPVLVPEPGHDKLWIGKEDAA